MGTGGLAWALIPSVPGGCDSASSKLREKMTCRTPRHLKLPKSFPSLFQSALRFPRFGRQEGQRVFLSPLGGTAGHGSGTKHNHTGLCQSHHRSLLSHLGAAAGGSAARGESSSPVDCQDGILHSANVFFLGI